MMAKDNIIKLIYRDKIFQEPENADDTADVVAVLDINDDTKISVLTYTPDVGMIDKRTSQRQAQGICKTGFQLESGERIGVGSELQISSSEALSDRLLQPGYHYK